MRICESCLREVHWCEDDAEVERRAVLIALLLLLSYGVVAFFRAVDSFRRD